MKMLVSCLCACVGVYVWVYVCGCACVCVCVWFDHRFDLAHAGKKGRRLQRLVFYYFVCCCAHTKIQQHLAVAAAISKRFEHGLWYSLAGTGFVTESYT